MTDPERVAEYYDRNTSRFLRFGGAGDVAAIHRRIWAPGVETQAQAFEYLNEVVAAAVAGAVAGAVAPATAARLLDLGCGVGGTATWLAQRLPVSVVGVANSAVQVELAAQRARRLGLEPRCRFELADFTDLPELGRFDGAYAIESFIHAARPERFFAGVGERLLPGGRLVICDDFLSESAARLPPQHPAWKALRRFTAGWQVANLDTPACAEALARSTGLRLVEARDLTAYLKPFHPPALRLLYAVTRLPLGWAYWQNLAGGSALQICTQQGWIRYLVLIFEKEGEECIPSPSNATSLPSIF